MIEEERMSIISELRNEIGQRIERETRYVVALSQSVSAEASAFIKEKLDDNNKTLGIINEFLIDAKDTSTAADWEKFYQERYWKA